MNHHNVALSAGLYLIATPIGTARDITLRALDILASADLLVAEDTRSLKHLMAIHGIGLGDRQVWSYHDHSKDTVGERIMAAIGQGASVAYAAEAGTPMISDPGYGLVRAAGAAGVTVTSVPGPSAAIAALTLAGLPTDRFLFLGFLPAKATARRKAIAEVAGVRASLVIYESPNRIGALLADLHAELGDRDAAICRELTKKFEDVSRGRLAALAEGDLVGKGEHVVVVAPPAARPAAGDREIETALRAALATGTVRDAAARVAADLGVPRKRAYQLALTLDAPG